MTTTTRVEFTTRAGGAATAGPAFDAAPWRRRAIVLSWLTIAWNLVEAGVSMAFGWHDESLALFGFGVDALIEVASAFAVLWRFRSESGVGGAAGLSKDALDRERRATLVIGTLFVLLASGTAIGSGMRLVAQEAPTTALPGVIVSIVSLILMAWLWTAKKGVATALNSATMAGDAACSKACIQLSVILLVGSAAYMLAPSLWWADSVAALGLAGLIGAEGVSTLRVARAEDFTGGCGCGSTSCEPG